MSLLNIIKNFNYDAMTTYLNDSNEKSELVQILTEMLANENCVTVTNFFEEYSIILSKDKQNFIYLEKLLSCIEKSNVQFELTKFIWQFNGFCQLLNYMPIHDNGSLYTSNSIFRTLINGSHIINNIDMVVTAYDNVVKCQPEFLTNYIKQIFMLNKAYSYSDITEIVKNDCTAYPLCLFCVMLMKKIINIYPENREARDIFLMGSYYIILPLNFIINTLSTLNCNEHNYFLYELQQVTKSASMQDVYAYILDTNFLQTYSDVDNFLISMCNHFSYFTGQQLRTINKIENFVIQILDSNIAGHIKFIYIELAISHSLCSYMLYEIHSLCSYMLYEIHSGLKRYIMTNVYELDIPRFVKIMHLINIVCKFGEIFDNDMTIYVYSELPGMEDYLKYVKFIFDRAHLGVFNNTTTNLIYDLSHFVNAISFILANFSNIGSNKNSFLYDILHLLIVMTSTFSHQSLCVPFLEVFVNKCLTHLPILFESCFEIIVDETFANLIDEINDNIESLKMHDTGKPEEYFNKLKCSKSNIRVVDKNDNFIDNLTCTTVINPMYLDAPDNVLVDYKTAFNLAKTKKNPYTRDTISLYCLLEYNERPEIKQKITKLKNDLAQCIAN